MISKKSENHMNDAEYGLDSRYSSDKEFTSESVALMKERLKNMKNLTREQIIRAKLMQLKLKMEDYVKQPVYDDQNHFSDFLKTYIDTIYPNRIKFARDINITPIRLSQVLNNHREPKEEFIMKLMIHSEKVYKNICTFSHETWFQVYFHEKICETMSSQGKWRKKLEKEINLNESLI